MTGAPGKEHGTKKPPPTRRVQKRSKGNTTCLTTSQNPSHWHPSWLNKAWTTRKDSESEWLAKDDLETNPITIKPETEPYGRAVLLGSLTLLLSTPVPFPNKISCFVSTCVSSDNSFPSVTQEPSLGPGRRPPSCNRTIISLMEFTDMYKDTGITRVKKNIWPLLSMIKILQTLG